MSPFAALSRDFARILGADLPEVDETYIGRVRTGNTDIGVPQWVPTEVRPGTTPLPVYPQQSQLDALDDLLLRTRAMIADCPPAFAGPERRA